MNFWPFPRFLKQAKSVIKLKGCVNLENALTTAANSTISGNPSTVSIVSVQSHVTGSCHTITDLWVCPDPSVKMIGALRGTSLFTGLGIKLKQECNNLCLGKQTEICPVKCSNAICKCSDCYISQSKYKVVTDRNITEKSLLERELKWDLVCIISWAIISYLVVKVFPQLIGHEKPLENQQRNR